MKCFVFRSTRKSDTYLFLADKENISKLPEGLQKLLGRTEYVLELDLSKTRTLANADVDQVLTNLNTQGYYIQLPKEQHVSE